MTGDLRIVRNEKLRDLLSKGPKYREPQSFTWRQNFDIIMNSCEEYARRWTKREEVELDTLSEWLKSISSLLKKRIRRLSRSFRNRHHSVFRDPNVVKELSRIHENFIVVPADKAANNYTFVCKAYYIKCLMEELGLHLAPGYPTYTITNLSP